MALRIIKDILGVVKPSPEVTARNAVGQSAYRQSRPPAEDEGRPRAGLAGTRQVLVPVPFGSHLQTRGQLHTAPCSALGRAKARPALCEGRS